MPTIERCPCASSILTRISMGNSVPSARLAASSPAIVLVVGASPYVSRFARWAARNRSGMIVSTSRPSKASRVYPNMRSRLVVHPDDPTICVDHEDGVGRRIDQAAEVPLALFSTLDLAAKRVVSGGQ